MHPEYIPSFLLVTLKLIEILTEPIKTWTKEKLQRVMASHDI